MLRKIILFGFLIFLIIYFGFTSDAFRSKKITDFESCVAYGNPVMESYPRRCNDSHGNNFVEKINVSELIQVDSPVSDEEVESPVGIRGVAKGNWFFEASFPVSIMLDGSTTVAHGVASAKSDWMTDRFVPFSAKLNFSVTEKTKAFLVLKKDNPSGISELDAEIRIPIILVPKVLNDIKTPVSADGDSKKCVIGGCSNQLCTDASVGPVFSTCEFSESYSCLKSAKCEVQSDGECGWTKTVSYNECIANINNN